MSRQGTVLPTAQPARPRFAESPSLAKPFSQNSERTKRSSWPETSRQQLTNGIPSVARNFTEFVFESTMVTRGFHKYSSTMNLS